MSEIRSVTPDDLSPAPEQKKPEQEPLTPQLASDIFFRSFEFSQGINKLQNNMFYTIHGLRPHWQFDSTNKAAFEERSEQRIRSYLGLRKNSAPREDKHVHAQITEERMVSNMQRVFGDFYKIFDMPFNLDKNPIKYAEFYAGEVGREMMNEDLVNMAKGRPRQGINPHSPKGDPHFSMVCEYGLKGRTTGIKVYDEMFDLVKKDIQKRITIPDDHPQKKFLEAVPLMLIKRYNETHPDSVIDIEELKKVEEPTALAS